jgi:hypothetical protein
VYPLITQYCNILLFMYWFGCMRTVCLLF